MPTLRLPPSRCLVGVTLLVLFTTTVMLVPSATAAAAATKYTKKQLRCGTCRLVLDDLLAGIESTNETYSIQTRFRIDEKKRVPYSRSEYNINEILESVCKKIGSVGVQHFGGQVPHVIKAGALKGSVSNLETSGDANKMVRRVCDDLVEEYIDEITLTYHRSEDEAEKKVCVEMTRSCSDSQFEELVEHHKVYLADQVATPDDAKQAEAVAAATAELEKKVEQDKPKKKKKGKKKKKKKNKKRKKKANRSAGGSDAPPVSSEEQSAAPTSGGSSATAATPATPATPAAGGSHSEL